MLACWFGNRPPGRSRDWRPVALTCFLWPGLPHTRGGSLERKHQSPPTWMPSLLIGGYLPKPPNPRWIVYAGEASPRKPTRNPLAYLTSENVQSVFFCNHRFSGNLAVKHPKAGERKAVKWTWNKWTVSKSLWVYAAKATLLLSFRRLSLL